MLRAIAENGLSLVITVASYTAKNLYPDDFNIKVGRMDLRTMRQFCLTEKIVALVDASHPYAVEVSQNAIGYCKKCRIFPIFVTNDPLMKRWGDGGMGRWGNINNTVANLDGFESLLTGNYLQGKRVLLTIGCQNFTFV